MSGFITEQTAYNTARITQPVYSKEKSIKDTITTEISLAKLDAMVGKMAGMYSMAVLLLTIF